MKKRRRFTAEFKAQIVLEVLTGVQSPAEACREHALSTNLLATWKAAFLEKAHTLSQGDERRDEDRVRIVGLEQLLGRATRQIEILKEASRLPDAASTGSGM
jgi:transposase